MEVENSEGDETESLVQVMRMFTQVSNSMFAQLEQASASAVLEQLLLHILNQTGMYSEVLVPRLGVPKCPVEYYKAFNKAILGRMFYISSVENLSRIHQLSREVQLRLLYTLHIKGATFCSELLAQYCSIIEELIAYYQEHQNNPEPPTLTLNYFTPDHINIPIDNLDLTPMYVQVADIKMCCSTLKSVLTLVSSSLPRQIEHAQKEHYERFFHIILQAMIDYNVEIKLDILMFFVKLIGGYEETALYSFKFDFPKVISDLMFTVESLLSYLIILHDNGEIDVDTMETFNTEISHLLELEEDYFKENPDVLNSICTIVLQLKKDSKVFSRKMKHVCLRLTANLGSQHCVQLHKLGENEIDIVSPNLIQKVLTNMKLNDGEHKLVEDACYEQMLNEMLNILNATEDSKLDYFVVKCHLEKCRSILGALLQIQILYDKWKQKQNELNQIVLPQEKCIRVLKTLQKVYRTHLTILKNDDKFVKVIMDIIISVTILMKIVPHIQFNQILHLSCLQIGSEFPVDALDHINEVQMHVLRQMLVLSLLLGNKYAEKIKKYILYLVKSLSRDKSSTFIIQLAPLLLINKVLMENQLLKEQLLPALLTKKVELQKDLPRSLRGLTCSSFGYYVVSLSTLNNTTKGHILFTNKAIAITLICSKCHSEKCEKTPKEFISKYIDDPCTLYRTDDVSKELLSSGKVILFEKFLNLKYYTSLDSTEFGLLLECFCNHKIFSEGTITAIFGEKSEEDIAKIIRPLLINVVMDEKTGDSQKDAIINICINKLVQSTRISLETNNFQQQKHTLNCIRELGLSGNPDVLLSSTKLLVYFIMHPQNFLAYKAVVYLKEICDKHDYTTNELYHRYKKDYCKLFVECSLYSNQYFSASIQKVLRAFGFIGLADFVSKDVHHFLPYLVPFAVKVERVPAMIEEIAALVQSSSAEFLSERFPLVYTHVYLYESDHVAKKSFELIEKITGSSTLNLIIKHHRVILNDLLLQYCSNPEKVLKACRYLARHDPETSSTDINQSLTLSQIADFLQPRFLGVLAYFDNKLVNDKVALSVKRKALQSFPDIMQLMGSKYLTPLRFKVLGTLRSTLALAKEFPKLLAQAWSAFIHNVDTISLGPLLSNLAVSLFQQLEYAPNEINKIFHYLVLSNENLLSAHIPDLFFLEETNVSERLKVVIKKHVKRTQPEDFLERVKWYLQYISQDIADVKIHALTCLDRLLKDRREDIHKAVFGRNSIDPLMVQLLENLKTGCSDPDARVRLASGACLGQLGALETSLLPRQYVSQDRSPFPFSISDDCFATAALLELTRAFQCERDTKIMDNYALTIQEILKVFKISPTGCKKQLWDSFPEHVHQILQPLLSSRYFLAFTTEPKTTHPLFGSALATNFIEWAHNWAGQLIPLTESESLQVLLRSVYPSMRRDTRTLLLFLSYILLHALMSTENHQFVLEEISCVVGMESNKSEMVNVSDRNCYRLLAPINITCEVNSDLTEDYNQLQSKCCKTVYVLLDFLNRWMLEWCNSKHHPTQSDKYKNVKQFMDKLDKLTLSRGNLAHGQLERALQQLELHLQTNSSDLQDQLPLLATILAALDDHDSVAGILTLKTSEPTLKELVLAQEVTGRYQDAAFCYERLAQQGLLDKQSLQGMVECYLNLDQPFTAYHLLTAQDSEFHLPELEAEPLWRLSRWDQLDKLVDADVTPSRENWGLLFGRVLVPLRSEAHDSFERAWRDSVQRLLSNPDASTLGGIDQMLGLHIITEARHAEELFRKIRSVPDAHGVKLCAAPLEQWRLRARLVHPETMQPLLRCRRALLHTQTDLERTHPLTAAALRSHIGELWLQSAKHARKAGNHQQAYTYILNAEQYRPPNLFVEKARVYWAGGQRDPAFTTLRRGLQATGLAADNKKICAKARLLIAMYNEETTNVDVEVNLQHYKDAVEAFKTWEKGLVCLGEYYEKLAGGSEEGERSASHRLHALNSYGKALQYGHKHIYRSVPRLLSIWLDYQVGEGSGTVAELAQLTDVVRSHAQRLPLYLFLTAFSQIVSRICHPVKQVYKQIKDMIVRVLLAYPQHTLWMLMCVMKSSYPQRHQRCQDVLSDSRLKEAGVLKFIYDFTQLAEKLIDLCNKPLPNNTQTASVRSLVSTLPRLLSGDNFSQIMMPFQQFCRIVLPRTTSAEERADFNVVSEPLVYIRGIEDLITILPSLQHPRKVTLTGSDGKPYIIMLKPKDDLRKDFRLMEFNGVVNRLLQQCPETRRRRLYIRTYSVLPLNEECGLIEWLNNLLGLRPILLHLYKQKGILTNNRELKEMMCSSKDPLSRKLQVFQEQLLPRHPPVLHEWYRRLFCDPYSWYQARSAYIRTTAVMSMVGYILGLGDRHGENILFDSTNGDTVHVDFNCLFNKGEGFEWPERVPFRLTHNMTHAMGPLGHEGMFRKCCEATMRELRAQSAALMSVIGPFVYDPLVTWSRGRAAGLAETSGGERVNLQARQHLEHIRQRLAGTVRTKSKQLSVQLCTEGQVEHLISEATSVENLCQMYLGWGPFL